MLYRPDKIQYIIPPRSSGSALGSPPCWTCLENLKRKEPRNHQTRCLNQLSWLLWARRNREGNSTSAARIPDSFFWSLPTAHGQRWWLERRSTGKSRALPFSSAPFAPPHSPHQTACPFQALLCHQSSTRPRDSWAPLLLHSLNNYVPLPFFHFPISYVLFRKKCFMVMSHLLVSWLASRLKALHIKTFWNVSKLMGNSL